MAKPDKLQETIVFSVGGSLLVTEKGIDFEFLKKFNQFIRKHIKKGRKFFIVVGGGTTARQYRDAGKEVVGEISSDDLDWLGIHTTRLNAHLIRTIFKDIAHPRIIENYDKKLSDWKESVVIGAGWKPGHSTDFDAVLLAKQYNAPILINLTNIDCIYDKDPNKFADAKPIHDTTWDFFETLVGQKWSPGANAPFDPVASQFAKKISLTVIIANGGNFSNLDNILNGEQFTGTIVRPLKIDASYYDRDYFEGRKGEYKFACTESVFGRLLQSAANWYRAIWIKLTLNPKSCLDVGCGTGRLVECLRKLNIEAHGIEISQYALDIAPDSIKKFLHYGDITQIPHEANKFELVVSFDVLEHLDRSKLQQAVKETVRVSSKYVLHKIYTRENKWITWMHHKDFSHTSVITKEYWLKLFKYLKEIEIISPTFRLPVFFETLFLLKKTNS